MVEMVRARAMLTPKPMATLVLAALVVGAAVVWSEGEVAWGGVMVMVISAGGILLLLLGFAIFWKRSKSSFRVALDPAGGRWVQASFRTCRSMKLNLKIDISKRFLSRLTVA